MGKYKKTFKSVKNSLETSSFRETSLIHMEMRIILSISGKRRRPKESVTVSTSQTYFQVTSLLQQILLMLTLLSTLVQ